MSGLKEIKSKDALEADELKGVVGGTAAPPPPPEDEMVPPPDGGEPPPPPMGDGEMPPPPPPDGEMGPAPPPHPDGHVNGFIEPLFDGLTYNETGLSTWTLEIDPSAVDLENDSFVVSADQVGEWEGGLPPEATDNGDGTYTITSWPIDSLVDNGDGTVTLNVDIGPMVEGGEFGGGEGGEPAVTPPHPDGDVNGFIDPLYDGLTYNESGPSEWTLPIDISEVDAETNSFVVSADAVGTPDPLPGCATDNGDGTYTISSWPIESVTDNGDGTVTLLVDIGTLAT